MFFIGILGIDNKSKEIKELKNVTCSHCESLGTVKLIKNYSYFHIFFIPIFKWNESYYLLCNKCNSTYIIPSYKGKAIEKGENIELTYWDLNKVNNTCKSCGKELDSNYEYCPYCGEKR